MAIVLFNFGLGEMRAQEPSGSTTQAPAAQGGSSQSSRAATSAPGGDAVTPRPQPAENVPLANQTPAAPTNRWTSYWQGEYATGDWAGYRTRLKDEGVEFFGFYNAIVAGNPVGGNSHAAAYADDFYFGLKFDLGKLVGAQGLLLEIAGVNRDGRDISREIGSRYSVMQLVGGQNLFLYDVFLDQKLFDDKLSLKAGRMSTGDDFATSPLYGYYLNNDIDGNIRATLFDSAFSAYPFPIWGARVRVDPNPEFNFMSGAYQESDDMFDSQTEGLDYRFHSTDGFMLVDQAGWTPEFAKQPVQIKTPDGQIKTVQKGLPGHYFAGGYYSRFHYAEFGSPTIKHTSYGFYAHGDQTIYQESPGSEQGLTVFGLAAYSPQQKISIIPLQLSGGLLYRGLIPGRDEDMSILGLTYGHFSGNYTNTLVSAGEGNPKDEDVIELGYRVQLNSWSYIQPDVQYVISPGGTGNIPDAVVVGAQFGLKF